VPRVKTPFGDSRNEEDRLLRAVLVWMLRESGLSLTGRLGGPEPAQHGEPTV